VADQAVLFETKMRLSNLPLRAVHGPSGESKQIKKKPRQRGF
jgi:hypothetical protein